MDVKELDILGASAASHWYYWSKSRAIERLAAPLRPSQILDIGAGSGLFSLHLLGTTGAGKCVCVDNAYSADTDKRLPSGQLFHRRRAIQRSEADLVLLMDVLEHVDDDVGFLSQYVRMSPPGSRFLITVPAFQWLWSGHDEWLGHRRRYTLRELEAVAQGAGLRIEAGMYFFALVLPIAASFRLLRRWLRGKQAQRSTLKPHSWPINTLLKAICALEIPWMRYNRLAGLSVILVAEKAAL